MSEALRSWGAGIVNHGAYDDLERCLDSLVKQSQPPSRIVVYDTGVGRDRLESFRLRYPQVEFSAGPNLGYAGGANRVVARLRNESPPAFVLILNPDVVLDPGFAETLITSLVQSPEVAIASGKLLRPERSLLDSAGIVFPRHRRPRDRGSEQLDAGQFDQAERLDAVTGAAMLLRVSNLDDLSLEGELFDESFFAYHEDTDLCWRARRLGYDVLYEPAAVAVHARGWKKALRYEVPVEIRRHSFKNHYLQWVKNEKMGDGLRNAAYLIVWETLRFGFVLLRDRELLGAYRDAWRLLPDARRKRALIRARAAARTEGERDARAMRAESG